MKRREFLAASGAVGAAALTAPNSLRAASTDAAPSEFYELRAYTLETEAQQALLDGYMKEAAIPAWNRAGIQPVGVFLPVEGISPVYVLLPHKTLDSVAGLCEKLQADAEHKAKGAAFLNAPAEAPAYKRIETSLLVAFRAMPRLETPAKGPDRTFQLRIYESPSGKTGRKKIEMFEEAGEIPLFREVGLNPVFFGRAIAGTKMPNLTYMLGFNQPADKDAAWKTFGAHPKWKELKAMPEYSDKAILCGITNILLKPASYSQI